MYVGSFFSCDKKLIAKTPVFVVSDQVIGNVRNEKIQLEMTVGGGGPRVNERHRCSKAGSYLPLKD